MRTSLSEFSPRDTLGAKGGATASPALAYLAAALSLCLDLRHITKPAGGNVSRCTALSHVNFFMHSERYAGAEGGKKQVKNV